MTAVAATPDTVLFEPRTAERRRAVALTALAAIGLAAAVALLLERFAILEDPTHVPSCTLNPILSCTSVMASDQASVFGFPNPLIGVVGFTVVLTAGMSMLSGARLGEWFWLSVQAGVTFGVVFVHWLAFQSLYRIGALCPYCLVVWAVMIPVFLSVTLRNLQRWQLSLPGPARAVLARAVDYRSTILTVWYLAIALLAVQRFWSYWSTLLP
ncbi:vitamin K epoxide reductase family protein [Cellulomonas sp. ES6]|uniref:vitamin K epoxide reductase family protein n=1 Tax=Cellulomonas sp. ES6 TaxID=3039384 RepID=UPI0024B7BA8B|nr:vitamin K epoxide reductase family protein [Cellulomonas sp. ES6]WHP16566.1 vitamin K epoxide reductase family protein [Cellulomonas sp. ES6]